MNQIIGRNILREVKAKCEPFKEEFSNKKINIIRFAPPPDETNNITLAKYEAARYSTEHKVKTFKFMNCQVDSQLWRDDTTAKEFEDIISAANLDLNTIGVIVQNPVPPNLKEILELIRPEKDLDGLQENHPLFSASATSETIARLVKSFASKDSVVAVVGGKGFVGRGVIKLLNLEKINCLSLDVGDNLLKTLQADIIVSATGVNELLDERHIRPYHQLVVDAGFIPLHNKIFGDVKQSAYEIPKNLTPVPGGVGPLQMATLLERLIKVATNRSIEPWIYIDRS